jgi:hypothetical protein
MFDFNIILSLFPPPPHPAAAAEGLLEQARSSARRLNHAIRREQHSSSSSALQLLTGGEPPLVAGLLAKFGRALVRLRCPTVGISENEDENLSSQGRILHKKYIFFCLQFLFPEFILIFIAKIFKV